MARQNNFYAVNASQVIAAGTATGATRGTACPAGISVCRISSSALAYVTVGPGATPTAVLPGSGAAGVSSVQINPNDALIITCNPGDVPAAITASGTAIVNITWLDG